MSFLWDFDDGTFSSEPNPSHSFGTNQKPYEVRLTVRRNFLRFSLYLTVTGNGCIISIN